MEIGNQETSAGTHNTVGDKVIDKILVSNAELCNSWRQDTAAYGGRTEELTEAVPHHSQR